MDDARIVDLFFARDESAISETQAKYGRYCLYIAASILGNDEDAKEIVNDTYLKLWNTIPPNRPEQLKPYVGMVSRQLSLDRYERYHAQKRGGQLPTVVGELAECVSAGDGGENVGDSVALRDALNRFVRSLPDRTQDVFIRRYWYASPVAEIAEAYGMKFSSVTVLLLRTRKKLKAFLKKEGFDV